MELYDCPVSSLSLDKKYEHFKVQQHLLLNELNDKDNTFVY